MVEDVACRGGRCARRSCGAGAAAALAQQELKQNPASDAVFAFRGRRGDRVKLLHGDGQGFCLHCEALARGRFPWPSPADGELRSATGSRTAASARLSSAQLAMLWEGIDRRRPAWSAPPARVV